MASRENPHHEECSVHELDLHQRIPLQTSVVKSDYMKLKPVTALSDNSTIEFHIHKSSKYTDISETTLELEVDIVQSDNQATRVAATDEVAPVCNFGASMFKDIQVYISDRKISGNQDNHPHRAYLENLLNRSKEEKQTWMYNEMWHPDTKGQFNTRTNANAGFAERQRRAVRGTIHMMVPLHIDIAHQHKLLPSSTDIHFRLIRTSPAFCLMGPPNHNFIPLIKSASLRVRQVTVSTEVALVHEKAVENTPFIYPMQRTETISHVIPTGNRNETYVLSNSGQLPTQAIITFVDNEAFIGNAEKNPFYFEHKNISSLQLVMNEQKVPSDAYRPDFQNGQYARMYDALYRDIGQLTEHGENCGITYEDFVGGYAIFPFDLTPDRSNNICRTNVLKTGQLREEITFEKGLPETTSLVNYLVYDNTLYLSQDRHPVTDYHMA